MGLRDFKASHKKIINKIISYKKLVYLLDTEKNFDITKLKHYLMETL